MKKILVSDYDGTFYINEDDIKHNIKKDNVYTIGDSYNDIEMLSSYNGCLMENAEDEMKKSYNKRYKSVSELINDLLGEENGK